MADAAEDNGPVLGRVDAAGRLVAADPELAALQEEAGSRVGSRLALPQLAAIAELAAKLGIAITRRAVAAGTESDVEFRVRAEPDGAEVRLSLDRWSFRTPAAPRLEPILATAGDLQQDSQPCWTTDANLKITYVSPQLAERLGVRPSDVVGYPLTRLFKLEEDDDRELPILSAVAAQQDFSGQPARARSGDGAQLYLAATAEINDEGQFRGFRGRALEERPDDGEPARGEDRAAMELALDDALRSPLGRIIRSADRIAGRSDGPLRADYASYASDIAAAARHLMEVMSSMTGEAGSPGKLVDLAGLADDSAGLLSSAADEKLVTIELSSREPLMARGDRSAVIQILVNLLGNAVRHSPAGGTVSLCFDGDSTVARVQVCDVGPGIDAADHERIFERFEQGDDAHGATGLGLAISRRLARAMGGDITLESRPGEGACFTFSLPAA